MTQPAQRTSEFPDADIQLRSEPPKVVEIQPPKKDPWEDKLELIKQTVAKGATDDELQLFLYVCKRTGLDPFMKQICMVRRWSKKEEQMVMTIQTQIDGYRLIADRTGKYAGSEKPMFFGRTKEDAVPVKAFIRIWKIVNGERCAFEAEAYWSEYYPHNSYTGFWDKMPHNQLAKCAEALALRKAFPAELNGIYTFEEMDQAGDIVNAQGRPMIATDGKVTVPCEDCGNPISDWKNEKHKAQRYSLDQVLTLGRSLYEKDLCGGCIERRNNTKVENAQEGFDAARAKRIAKKTTKPAEETSPWEHMINSANEVPDAIGRKYNVAR